MNGKELAWKRPSLILKLHPINFHVRGERNYEKTQFVKPISKPRINTKKHG
jgi:hypothetical protein